MSKYDKIKKDNNAQREIEQQLNFASQGMEELVDDTQHTADIYNNAESVLNDIDERFMKATKLDKTDVAFLMLATALQVGRWVLFAELSKAIDNKTSQARVDHNDKSIVDMEKEKRNQYKEKHINDEHIKSKKHRDWANIVFDSVPYDISVGCKKYGIKMEGGFHRIHTLGHDPILGWLFGTINILSDTITLDKSYLFRTFNVEMMNRPKQWTSESSIAGAFQNAYDSVREDSNRLPAAVFAQALHLKSDEYTKLGLPIPLLEAFNPDLAGKLYKEGYDSLQLLKDVKPLAIYGGQAIVSVVINMLITLVHGLFYDEEKHQSRELYEVKTRKILSYSNMIASSSNVITVAGMSIAAFYTENPDLAKKALSTLDVGGIIVTMYRLLTDTKFIHSVKSEFLEKEWYNAVVGNEYKFVAEAKEMGKKDILKGIEIQAKADAAKAEKVAEGLAVHAEVLNDIKDTQHTVHQKVDVVLQDMSDQEANTLYGLKTNKRLSDLDYTEKRVLSAVIYTLMANSDYISDLQRKFFACVESYGVSERVSDFNFDNLRNIDSYSDRKIILKAICAFLFLKEFTFDFKNNEKYEWLAIFTSQRDVDEVCKDIQKEFSILGGDGIVNGYLLPITVSEQTEIKELPKPETVEETVADDMSYDYEQLFETIAKVTTDEKAFGKRVSKLDQAFVNKELGKEYPKVSAGAVIEATRIANGCLIFSTYALYLKVGNILTGKYVRLPYQKIIADKIHTGEGKLKGTRKLIIPYINEANECVNVEIDDIKVAEEKLRDLLVEITSLNCTFPSTDENTQFIDLDKKILLLFATVVVSVLKKNKHLLTEAYLVSKEWNLQGEWNRIVQFDNNEKLGKMIDAFINSIPYPSELFVTDYAMQTFMRIMTRTNRIEGNEATLLMKDEEALIRRLDMFDRLSNAEFNILLKNCSKDIRETSLDELNEIVDEVKASDILCKDSIIAGLQKMIEVINAEEEAKKNTPTAKLKRAVQDNAMPAAKKAVKKAEEQLKQIKLPGKKEELIFVPNNYRLLDEELPSDMALPKGAIPFGMATDCASAFMVCFEVNEDAAMPFDNPELLINSLHKYMRDDEGIIEVVSTIAKSGKKVAYDIIKHNMKDDNGFSLGTEYTLNLNIKINGKMMLINGSFVEEGMTGIRDTAVYEMFRRENPNLENPFDGWMCDPYDETYKNGYLMNMSEKAEYDVQFPEHPLSEVRKYIEYILSNN